MNPTLFSPASPTAAPILTRQPESLWLSGHRLAAALLTVMLLVNLVVGAGCGREPAPTTNTPPVGSPQGDNRSVASGDSAATPEGLTSGKRTELPKVIQAGKVEFRVGEGEEVFYFEPKDNGTACKLYDADDTEICKLTFTDGKLKVKSPDDKPLFELKAKDDKLMIKDASGENELFKLKFKGTTVDFYQPGDVRLYRIKLKDYGWRLEDNQDQTLFRAKKSDDKVVLRDPNDQTVLYSKDITGTMGLVFFRIKELSREQQAACCLWFLDK